MARPPRRDDDDLEGLPPIEGEDGGVDVDLAGELDGGEEAGGLDASLADELEAEGLEGLDGGEDEAADGWEADEGAEPEDPALAEGEEGSWSEDAEEAEPTGWDADLSGGAGDDRAPATEDRGEEGLDESWEPTTPDAAPIERTEERLADDLDIEGDGRIEPEIAERPERSLLQLPRLALAEARWLGPAEAITWVGHGLCTGRALHRFDLGPVGTSARAPETSALEMPGIEGEEPTSAAVTASGALVVGLAAGGAARSVGGRPFERLVLRGRVDGPFHVTGERHTAGVRLWGTTRSGILARSEDEGETWSRPLVPGTVLAFAVGADGGVVAVIGSRRASGERPLSLLRSADGGRTWRSGSGPRLEALPDEAELRVAALGPYLAVSCDAPGLGVLASADGGKTFRRLEAAHGAGPIALVREAAGAVLYAGLLVEERDRGLVVRIPLEDEDEAHVVLDLEEVRGRQRIPSPGAADGDQRVHALHVERAGGRTTLLAGTGLGLVRVVLAEERGP